MRVDRAVREAELAFLNAPFQRGGWLDAVQLLAALTGSRLAQLCGGSGDGLGLNVLSGDLHDPHGHLHNPRSYGWENFRINCSGRGSLQTERDYGAYRSLHRSEFYDDAVSDLDLPFGCHSYPLRHGSDVIALALLRSSRDGPCSAEMLGAFEQVARQAQREVRVGIALGKDRGETMLASLAASGEMTLLLDGNGRLVAMTEASEALFDCPFGLRLDGLHVRLARDSEDRSLRAAMTRLLEGDGLDGPVLHQCRAGSSDERPEGCWQLFLTRLPGNRDLLGVEAQLALTLRPSLAAARLV